MPQFPILKILWGPPGDLMLRVLAFYNPAHLAHNLRQLQVELYDAVAQLQVTSCNLTASDNKLSGFSTPLGNQIRLRSVASFSSIMSDQKQNRKLNTVSKNYTLLYS